MGKTLLIDTAKIPNNPTTSHCRTAIEISNNLGIELISTSEELLNKNPCDYSKYAIIGSAFYPKTAEIESFIRRSNNPEIFWINNEHTCSPNSEYARLIKDHDSTIISNLVENGNKVKGYDRFILLNINCLLYSQQNSPVEKKYDMLYYGTYRPGRRLYFQKYFSENDDFILLSKTKNLRKFNQLCGCNCRFADSPDWTKGRESFNLVKYTIYLEDELMHKNFNHLSNRFYEALYCNVVQFFDVSCRKTVEMHGLYKVDDFFYVSSKHELKEKIRQSNYFELIKKQTDYNKIAELEKTNIIDQLKKILL